MGSGCSGANEPLKTPPIKMMPEVLLHYMEITSLFFLFCQKGVHFFPLMLHDRIHFCFMEIETKVVGTALFIRTFSFF